jgi:hypothetical protein
MATQREPSDIYTDQIYASGLRLLAPKVLKRRRTVPHGMLNRAMPKSILNSARIMPRVSQAVAAGVHT